MERRHFHKALAMCITALCSGCSVNDEQLTADHQKSRIIAQAQARIQSLSASIDSVELFSGKRQSPEKIDFYRLEIAREEQVIECARSPHSLNCEQVGDATHPAQAPCPDEHLAR
ncbi:MAG: hypothetical protein ACRER5_17205 [Pseudomonas sp.]